LICGRTKGRSKRATAGIPEVNVGFQTATVTFIKVTVAVFITTVVIDKPAFQGYVLPVRYWTKFTGKAWIVGLQV
jgi:hypothetical protein